MKVLKFGAIWCNGCLVMKPRWQEIEEELPWLETEYYDYDEDIKQIEKWKVSDMLPTFVFVDKKEAEIFRLTGEQEKDFLLELINEHKDK